jgi:glycosyltransferase involved in cell wall biosynthesis
VKLAIVVPYSWSFWGGVVDHAEQQLLALRELGVDAWLVMGNDPPGSFTHVLHPGLGRHMDPPPYVLPVGRSVIVPANGTLPNIVLTPATPRRMKRIFERERVPDDGIDILGVLTDEDLTAELLAAKALVAPSLGGESFGMVLTRAFACALPVVASDISGYRSVVTPETGVLVPPGDERALADGVDGLLGDEPRRVQLGAAARVLVQERYAWRRIASQLVEIYEAAA